MNNSKIVRDCLQKACARIKKAQSDSKLHYLIAPLKHTKTKGKVSIVILLHKKKGAGQSQVTAIDAMCSDLENQGFATVSLDDCPQAKKYVAKKFGSIRGYIASLLKKKYPGSPYKHLLIDTHVMPDKNGLSVSTTSTATTATTPAKRSASSPSSNKPSAKASTSATPSPAKKSKSAAPATGPNDKEHILTLVKHFDEHVKEWAQDHAGQHVGLVAVDQPPIFGATQQEVRDKLPSTGPKLVKLIPVPPPATVASVQQALDNLPPSLLATIKSVPKATAPAPQDDAMDLSATDLEAESAAPELDSVIPAAEPIPTPEATIEVEPSTPTSKPKAKTKAKTKTKAPEPQGSKRARDTPDTLSLEEEEIPEAPEAPEVPLPESSPKKTKPTTAASVHSHSVKEQEAPSPMTGDQEEAAAPKKPPQKKKTKGKGTRGKKRTMATNTIQFNGSVDKLTTYLCSMAPCLAPVFEALMEPGNSVCVALTKAADRKKLDQMLRKSAIDTTKVECTVPSTDTNPFQDARPVMLQSPPAPLKDITNVSRPTSPPHETPLPDQEEQPGHPVSTSQDDPSTPVTTSGPTPTPSPASTLGSTTPTPASAPPSTSGSTTPASTPAPAPPSGASILASTPGPALTTVVVPTGLVQNINTHLQDLVKLFQEAIEHFQ